MYYLFICGSLKITHIAILMFTMTSATKNKTKQKKTKHGILTFFVNEITCCLIVYSLAVSEYLQDVSGMKG